MPTTYQEILWNFMVTLKFQFLFGNFFFIPIHHQKKFERGIELLEQSKNVWE